MHPATYQLNAFWNWALNAKPELSWTQMGAWSQSQRGFGFLHNHWNQWLLTPLILSMYHLQFTRRLNSEKYSSQGYPSQWDLPYSLLNGTFVSSEAITFFIITFDDSTKWGGILIFKSLQCHRLTTLCFHVTFLNVLVHSFTALCHCSQRIGQSLANVSLQHPLPAPFSMLQTCCPDTYLVYCAVGTIYEQTLWQVLLSCRSIKTTQ